MLRELLPKMYRAYERSQLAAEFHEFAAWLRETGYSDHLICRHLCRLRRVLESGNATVGKEWPATKLNALFERYCKNTFIQQTVAYHATRRAYEHYLDTQGRLHKDRPPEDPFRRFRAEYRSHLEEVRGFCLTTTAHHLATVSEFLASASVRGGSLAHLSSAHIERYLSNKSRTCSRHTLQHVVAHLRAFFRYALARAIIPERLDTIDTPRAYRGELPPRALPWVLVSRLLSSIDRTSRAGWRDYTMLHLMAYYGLRALEVADLRVDRIDWSAKACRVEQRKTHCDLILPLSDRTMNLLRRYLRHGRPKTTHPQLFLRARNPAGRIRHTAVCAAFYKRARESGLSLQGYSSYSLRHAFAMRLLQRGVGVKAIGDCLGHHSLEATCVYLRLNVAALRTVGLPLPRVTP
jgi:site-specific recombinase XerD